MDPTSVVDQLGALTKDEATQLISLVEQKWLSADAPVSELDEHPTDDDLKAFGELPPEELSRLYSRLCRGIRRNYGTLHCGVLMAERERIYTTLKHLRGYRCPQCSSLSTRKDYTERVCGDCGHRAERGLFLGLVYDRGY